MEYSMNCATNTTQISVESCNTFKMILKLKVCLTYIGVYVWELWFMGVFAPKLWIYTVFWSIIESTVRKYPRVHSKP